MVGVSFPNPAENGHVHHIVRKNRLTRGQTEQLTQWSLTGGLHAVLDCLLARWVLDLNYQFINTRRRYKTTNRQ